MKFAIIGGGGFMGSYLSQALLARAGEVTVFDRADARYLDLVRQAGAAVVTGDFLNPSDLDRAIAGSEFVYHLASTTVPQTSSNDPAYDVKSNVLGSLALLEASRKAAVKKVVFASSGGTVYGIPKEIPIKESHPTDPTSSHGVCKLAIEKYLHYYWILYGLDYCILRIANAYGERQPVTGTQGVISTFLDKALRSEELMIWGDGSVVRDYVYIEDIIDALVKAVTGAEDLRIFNIGAGTGHSVTEIISIIETITHQSLKLKFTHGQPYDVPVNVLDVTRARVHLGWQPKVGLFEGMTRTYEWMLRMHTV